VTAKKGDLVAVEGALRSRSWEADGAKHWITEVISSRVRVLAKKRKDKSEEAVTQDSGGDPIADEELIAEEIPF